MNADHKIEDTKTITRSNVTVATVTAVSFIAVIRDAAAL